jgi:hypothetical protein
MVSKRVFHDRMDLGFMAFLSFRRLYRFAGESQGPP